MCFKDISLYNSAWTTKLTNLTELPEPMPRCARLGGVNAGPDFQHFDITLLYSLGFSTFKVMRQRGQKWTC